MSWKLEINFSQGSAAALCRWSGQSNNFSVAYFPDILSAKYCRNRLTCKMLQYATNATVKWTEGCFFALTLYSQILRLRLCFAVCIDYAVLMTSSETERILCCYALSKNLSQSARNWLTVRRCSYAMKIVLFTTREDCVQIWYIHWCTMRHPRLLNCEN